MTDGFTVTFQMTRADYVAMFRALMGRPWWHRWALMIGWVALWLAIMAYTAPSIDHFWRALGFVVQGKAGWGLYFGFLMLPILFFWEDIAAYVTGTSFAKNEIAQKPSTIRADSRVLHVSIGEVSSEIGWNAIHKVIETPLRLFLVISTRQAAILPRAAFASEAAYAAARDFILAQVGRGVPFVQK